MPGLAKLPVQAFFGQGKIESPAFLAASGDFHFLYFTGVLFAINALADRQAAYRAARPAAGQPPWFMINYAVIRPARGKRRGARSEHEGNTSACTGPWSCGCAWGRGKRRMAFSALGNRACHTESGPATVSARRGVRGSCGSAS